MTDDDDIHIKVELTKNKNSGNLSLATILDIDAPNFYKDGEDYIWIPTKEERKFMNEAFKIFYKNKSEISNYKANSKKDQPYKNIENEDKEEKPSPFEKNASAEQVKQSGENKDESKEEEVLVKADKDAIDSALEKNKQKRKEMREADEETIIKKVLDQKKKWKKDKD